MRPLVVVVPTPGVEAGLGRFEAQKAAALQELGLHGPVQALELAHGLWMAGAAPQGLDAQPDQPDREPGELCRTVLLSPGIAVVGEHGIGQTVPLEHPRQPRADGGLRLIRASLCPEQIARMIVKHG